MRSTESGTAALQLGLGGRRIDRHETGGRDRTADRGARVSQRTYGRRRGSPPRWSDPPHIRRMDLVRGVAQDDHRLLQASGEIGGRDGQVLPHSMHAGTIPPIERRVDFALAGVEDRTHGQCGERQKGRHRVERRHRHDRDGEGEGQPLDSAEADPKARERSRPHGDRETLEVTDCPTRVGQEAIDGTHQALGVRSADVERVLTDNEFAVEERGAAGQRRGLHGEQTHAASLARDESAAWRRSTACDNAPRRARMSAGARKDPAAVETEVREKIHLEILKRTGAYHANDHILLPSGQHTSEYIEKTLVTTEPSFTEGLGAVIAKHFAQWPVDMVLSTGACALILAPCLARAHPSRPVVIYGTKGLSGGKRRGTLPPEFQRLIPQGARGLLIEDLVSTGTTLDLLINLVEQLGAEVVGVGCLWRRTSVELNGKPRSEEHTSELQSRSDLVCRLLLEKKKKNS